SLKSVPGASVSAFFFPVESPTFSPCAFPGAQPTKRVKPPRRDSRRAAFHLRWATRSAGLGRRRSLNSSPKSQFPSPVLDTGWSFKIIIIVLFFPILLFIVRLLFYRLALLLPLTDSTALPILDLYLIIAVKKQVLPHPPPLPSSSFPLPPSLPSSSRLASCFSFFSSLFLFFFFTSFRFISIFAVRVISRVL
ncbi:hypothetical protein BO78DRAFT_427011, partial [Aspergillus sclerotiicarbonarius CBS 121057]